MALPSIPGFDGLIALSRREGVDVRPTLLRVLTDLYVQTPTHSSEEEQHYVALASRLITEVDDATRAMVRARLAIYPRTPPALAEQLAIAVAAPEPPAAPTTAPAPPANAAAPHDDIAAAPAEPAAAMLPLHAAELSEMFWAAGRAQRLGILHQLEAAPLPRAARVAVRRRDRAIETLDQAAFIADAEIFALELGDVLMLPTRLAQRIVADPGGEPLACAAKALGLPQAVYERVLLFLDARRGATVAEVYRLARLYQALTPHAAQVVIAALRGATLRATRAKYVPQLYDDEHSRPRAATPAVRTARVPDLVRRRAGE